MRRLAVLGALRRDLTESDGAAIFATLTATGVYGNLTSEHDWTFDACEVWLVRTLMAQLLASGGPVRAGPRRAG